MTHEPVPLKHYIAVWAVLMILTVTTALVATVDLGIFNIVVAMTIAVVKMLLVVVIFMHVRQADALTRLFVVAGFFWLVILLVFTLSDYFTRGWLPVGKMW